MPYGIRKIWKRSWVKWVHCWISEPQNTTKKFILVNLNTHIYIYIYMLSLLFIFHKAGKEKRIEKRSARSSTNNQLFKYSVRTLFVLYFVQLDNRIGETAIVEEGADQLKGIKATNLLHFILILSVFTILLKFQQPKLHNLSISVHWHKYLELGWHYS